MLGYPKDVEQVVLNTNVIQSMKKNSILVDHTTSQPALAQLIHQKCQEQGVYALDCPVTGGDIGARNGTLSILCGGDK